MGISFVYAQNCPVNIGFESGSFNSWKTFYGNTSSNGTKNAINVAATNPIAGRHTVNSSKTAIDRYGKFPVLAPNGSGYSVKLGDDGTGSQADRISYQFTVPADKSEFNITYQYAVVFEDPSHPAHQQPRFTAKILDLSTNTYITCASFEYIATSSLPGFKRSSEKASVLYKDWSAVNINLAGYQGKQVLLEFTTADCTQSGHFGYAYIDVNENCESIIQGNEFCPGTDQVTLKGPSGFNIYKWYNSDKSILYGEGESITIKPALPVGEKVVLDLLPFDGFGCPYSISTIIQKGFFDLDLIGTINACKDELVDLTSSKYILNKSANLTYTFFTDPELKNPVLDPTKIATPGKYYVNATAAYGCNSTKSVNIIFHEIVVDVVSEIKNCADVLVDLTSNNVQKNVPSNLIVTYYSDLALTIPLPDPKKISQTGIYFIKFQNQYCAIVKKIDVEIYRLPILNITNSVPVCAPLTVDITDPNITAGSDTDITLSYFTDLALTIPLANPKAITSTGNYYIKAVNTKGCTIAKSVFVEIYTLPVLEIKNPAAVCAPETIDITDLKYYHGTTANVKYTFYDSSNGKVVNNPKEISKTGTYWVNIKNENNCAITKEIKVVINPQPKIVINQPKKVFITQSVDITKASIIDGSKGYIKIGYWKDINMNVELQNPTKITQSGNYYISLTNSFGCNMVGEVKVDLVELPKIVVPTAFTPFKSTNNKLYPFISGLKKLTSFKVYNKWGNLVFETNDHSANAGWNGTYKNAAQPFETYTWFAEGVNLLDQVYTAKGNTILIP